MIRTRFAPSPTGFYISVACVLRFIRLPSPAIPAANLFCVSKTRIKKGKLKELSSLCKKPYAYSACLGMSNIFQSQRVKAVCTKSCRPTRRRGSRIQRRGSHPHQNSSRSGNLVPRFCPGQRHFLEDRRFNRYGSLKSDGFPTYHLAVVVDDHDMGVTHVLRGHDWLPSTPIHLASLPILGYEKPQIGHLTDIMDPGRGQTLKRKGSTSVEQLMTNGYLPEAILNFVILLGWAPKDNRELFTLDDLSKTSTPAVSRNPIPF